MKIKKVLAITLCVLMVLCNGILSIAESDNQDVAINESCEIWNTNLVDETISDIYSDFPFSLDKVIGKDMDMSITMLYLKNLEESDSVTVTILDDANSQIVQTYEITKDHTSLTWENVENNKTFLISVEENLNGVIREYAGVISTSFVPASFPVDLKLGNKMYYYNNGETFSHVMIKKVGENPVCQHDEDEECDSSCSISHYIQTINPDELSSFYAGLDSDSYYELQVQASGDDTSKIYQGFISTSENGADLGVFTRGFSFSQSPSQNSANQALQQSQMNSAYATNASDVTSNDFDFTNPFVYQYYKNEQGTLAWDNYLVVKWTVPETSSYTIETIGNSDMIIYDFSENNGIIQSNPTYRRDGGTGENPKWTTTIIAGQIKYYVIKSENNEDSMFAFRIIRNAYAGEDDGIPAYRDIVQANYDNGNFSQQINSCDINYDGDVNIFAYNVSSGKGCLAFEDVDTPLKAEIYSVTGRTDGMDNIWKENMLTANKTPENLPDEVQYFSNDFSSGVHYIDVYQASLPNEPVVGDDIRNLYSYNFTFYDPRQKDAEDLAAHPTYGNNSPVTATELAIFNKNTFNNLTLHRGDSDWFKFTTDVFLPMQVDIKLYNAGPNQYNINLYESVNIISEDPPEWSDLVPVGTFTNQTDFQSYFTNSLGIDQTYYIEVSAPNSQTYASWIPYTLEVDISQLLFYSAEFTNGGYTILGFAGLDYMRQLTASLITTYCNGYEIEDSHAADYIEFSYNGNIIDQEFINNLGPGGYDFVPLYHGSVVTGGYITLALPEEIFP